MRVALSSLARHSPALLCSGKSGVVVQRGTEVGLETGAGQSVLGAEVSHLAF